MIALCCVGFMFATAVESPRKLAAAYVDAIEDINAAHAKAPGKTREVDLEKKFPAVARKAFDALLLVKAEDELVTALSEVADAAADLDLERDFEIARARIEVLAPDQAKKVGRLVSRERFLVRGTNGLDANYLGHFADVFEAILGAYDDVFGFAEFSKVPGKKLRVLVHLEDKIEAPPHFAPEFRWHSQIDFPVADPRELKSPTADGKFLFYGLCHELGHVVAMWGDGRTEADHHAWAHYAGVAIVEHLAGDARASKLLTGLDDVRWRSLTKEREALKGVTPSTETKDGVMALFLALGDKVGTRAIGAAINALDAKGGVLRINAVRYYDFKRLRATLLELAKDEKSKQSIKDLLP